MARRDPYRNFKFELEIGGFVRAGAAKITGLEVDTEVIEYREGGDNETPRKLSGQRSYGDITIERGASEDEDYISWVRDGFDPERRNGRQGDAEASRRLVVIYLKDEQGRRVRKWRVFAAWPRTYRPGDLDASDNSVLMNQLVLANEGWVEERIA